MAAPATLQNQVAQSSVYNPRAEAQDIHDALRGLGTNEQLLIEVLSRERTVEQEQLLNIEYRKLFNISLNKALKADTSFNFGSLCRALAMPLHEYKAKRLREATDCIGTQDQLLIDILAWSNNKEIENIRHYYACKYSGRKGMTKETKEKREGMLFKLYTNQGMTTTAYNFRTDPTMDFTGISFEKLDNDIKSDTSFNFERVLTMLLRAGRVEDPRFDDAEAEKEAQVFYDAGEGRWGTDDDRFIRILCGRSRPYLAALDAHYKKKFGHGLAEAIRKETSGDYRDCLLALVEDHATYWAHRVRKACKGLGTNDRLLIQIVRMHTKEQLAAISAKHKELFGTTLEDEIRDETSGAYMNLLLAKCQKGTYIVEATKVGEVTKIATGGMD